MKNRNGAYLIISISILGFVYFAYKTIQNIIYKSNDPKKNDRNIIIISK
jgi:hypothetical protein